MHEGEEEEGQKREREKGDLRHTYESYEMGDGGGGTCSIFGIYPSYPFLPPTIFFAWTWLGKCVISLFFSHIIMAHLAKILPSCLPKSLLLCV